MTQEDRMPHGKVCYLEIPAREAKASSAFYSEVFGWSVRKRGDG
jgi:predicted enzyme related to lactoylglutathione lyase